MNSIKYSVIYTLYKIQIQYTYTQVRGVGGRSVCYSRVAISLCLHILQCCLVICLTIHIINSKGGLYPLPYPPPSPSFCAVTPHYEYFPFPSFFSLILYFSLSLSYHYSYLSPISPSLIKEHLSLSL